MIYVLALLTLAGFLWVGKQLRCIMVKQTEVATRLEAIDTGLGTLSTLVGKVKGETESILAGIGTDKENASPEVVAALEKVEARLVGVNAGLSEVDALVADIGPEVPPVEPEEPLPA